MIDADHLAARLLNKRFRLAGFVTIWNKCFDFHVFLFRRLRCHAADEGQIAGREFIVGGCGSGGATETCK